MSSSVQLCLGNCRRLALELCDVYQDKSPARRKHRMPQSLWKRVSESVPYFSTKQSMSAGRAVHFNFGSELKGWLALWYSSLHVGIYRVCCEWGRMRRVGPSFATICTWRGSGITTSANSLSKETRDWMEHICEDAPRKSGLICHLLACSQYLDIPDGHIPRTLP